MSYIGPDTRHLVLLGMELFHVATHAKVLFAIGKPMTEQQLRSRLAYFIWDALTVLLSALSLSLFFPALPRSPFAAHGLLSLLAAAQIAQHLRYVLSWHSGAAHVEAILEWSAMGSGKERRERFGGFKHAVKWAGTAYDAGVHAAMAGAHAAWLAGWW
ncbi:hypothetical protein DFJ74DRAFT_729003 [Hyaloraphidium curvatum]|nr:hypothetical protein DFJ74DRAFT_729003 [Hyaloraphidium curvatum]